MRTWRHLVKAGANVRFAGLAANGLLGSSRLAGEHPTAGSLTAGAAGAENSPAA